MSVIDDLRAAVENYATDSCKTEIIEYSINSPGGQVLNTGEVFQFKVRVTNNGHLDMTDVKIEVLGSAYSDVATLSSSFGSSANSVAFSLNTSQVHTTGFFRGKAKSTTGGLKDIVTAKIKEWNANFDHILKDHSSAGAAEGVLKKDILAN